MAPGQFKQPLSRFQIRRKGFIHKYRLAAAQGQLTHFLMPCGIIRRDHHDGVHFFHQPLHACRGNDIALGTPAFCSQSTVRWFVMDSEGMGNPGIIAIPGNDLPQKLGIIVGMPVI